MHSSLCTTIRDLLMVSRGRPITVQIHLCRSPADIELVFSSGGAGYLKRKEKEKEGKKKKKEGRKRGRELRVNLEIAL